MYGGVEDSSDKDKLMEEKRELEEKRETLKEEIKMFEGQKGNCESDLEEETGHPNFTGRPNEFNVDDVAYSNTEIKKRKIKIKQIKKQIDKIKKLKKKNSKKKK